MKRKISRLDISQSLKRNFYILFIIYFFVLNLNNFALSNEKNCYANNILFIDKSELNPNTSDEYILESDYSTILNKDQIQLRGNVSINSQGKYMEGDKFDIFRESNDIKGQGNIKYSDNNISLLGDNISYNKNVVQATNVSYLNLSTNEKGTSKEIKIKDDTISMKNANYSTCPLNNNDWAIEAESILINNSENSIEAKISR